MRRWPASLISRHLSELTLHAWVEARQIRWIHCGKMEGRPVVKKHSPRRVYWQAGLIRVRQKRGVLLMLVQ